MTKDDILQRLQALANPTNTAGLARYGIRPQTMVYGVSVNILRDIAKEIKRDHALAEALWATDVHEARLLATMIADHKQISADAMERWALTFDSWDIVDQTCSNLFYKTPFAQEKVTAWTVRDEEFIKRAGFVLMAALSVHDKKAPDELFLSFLPIIQREASDARNFVKKAINWALRQIGKRNLRLNAAAIATAEQIQQIDSKAARWVAADALRELRSQNTQARLQRKAQ
ncbi:MAG: DNA alkylation repair protein [Chloroflexi bacterium]|nr:DNA alkylation repair protein [Chloroflexota bacterium]